MHVARWEEEEERFVQCFSGGIVGERDNLEDLGVDGNILKWIL